jgi:defect-in-organelle-trafficking protein DotB
MSSLIYNNLPIVITDQKPFDDMLFHAVEAGCSDIFLNSKQPGKTKVHGRNHHLTNRTLQDSELTRFIELSYGAEGPARMGAARPLNYKYDIEYERKKKIRFRVNATKAEHGYFIALRYIPEVPPTVEDLSVEKEIMECVTDTNYGVFFVCGGTGNGKSTLLSAVIRYKLEKEANNNIVTYESPIEFTYSKIEKGSNLISQHEIGIHVKAFNDGVINAMRQAPTVILVGESRDFETISSSLEAATTGHQVYTTLHTTDVRKTIPRVISMFPISIQEREKNTLIDTTSMILCQRLVPTTDGKRCAIREFIRFDEQIRDQLRGAKDIASTIGPLLESYGKPFSYDLSRLLKEKRIDKATYKKFQF